MNHISRRFWLLGMSLVLLASANTVQAVVEFTTEVVKVNPTCIGGDPLLLGEFCANNTDCDSAEGAGDGLCGGDITPTSDLAVSPGDTLVAHYRVGDWAADGEECRSWQVDLDLASFFSGECGSITPRGWDRDLYPTWCNPYHVDPCPGDEVCDETGTCVGPNHQPELGFFIELERPDYIFFGRPQISAVDYGNYRAGSFDMGFPPFTTNDSPPRYLATLVLEVSADVCGQFELKLRENPDSFLLEPVQGVMIQPTTVDILHLEIIPPPDAVCGNNVREEAEQCDGPDDANCPGLCQTNCTCPGETIPAVSEWGILILMLSLLVGIKLKFSRRPTPEVN